MNVYQRYEHSELEATNAEGMTIEPSFIRPNQLFHIVLDETV